MGDYEFRANPPWPSEEEILAAFDNPALVHTDEHGGRYVVVGEVARFYADQPNLPVLPQPDMAECEG